MGLFDTVTKTLEDNPMAALGIGTSTAGGLLSLFGNRQGSNESNAIKLLQDNFAAAKEGFTDAQGNRIRYVPGKGWVTEMANKTAVAQDANNTANMMKMASENVQSADAMRDLSSTDIANILSSANRVSNKNALDKQTSAAVRSAGTGSNMGAILGGLAESSRENMADTEANAMMESILNKGNINTARTSPYIANAIDLSTPFKTDKANLNSMSGNLMNMSSGAGNALATATATQDPNSSFMSKFGSTLQGLGMGFTDLNKANQNKKQSQAYNRFLNNYSAGGW